MSLAPSEQRALARIEESLRTSDPRLAAMMAAFSHLADRRRIVRSAWLSPRQLRLRRLIVMATALGAIGLIVAIVIICSYSG